MEEIFRKTFLVSELSKAQKSFQSLWNMFQDQKYELYNCEETLYLILSYILGEEVADKIEYGKEFDTVRKQVDQWRQSIAELEGKNENN